MKTSRFIKKKLFYFAVPSISIMLLITSLQATFLGPLALLSLPSSIQSLVSMKKFADIKRELVKVLPHFAVLATLLSIVLLIVIVILLSINFIRLYQAIEHARLKNYSRLLHYLLLEITLHKEIAQSDILKKIKDLTQKKEYRKKYGINEIHIIDEGIEKLLSSHISLSEKQAIIKDIININKVVNK